jgi:hypothetical protein
MVPPTSILAVMRRMLRFAVKSNCSLALVETH